MMRSNTENNSKFYIIFRIFTLKYYKASHIAIYNDAKYKYDARKPGIGHWIGGQRGP